MTDLRFKQIGLMVEHLEPLRERAVAACRFDEAALLRDVKTALGEVQDLSAWKTKATQQLLERYRQAEELIQDRDRALQAARRAAENDRYQEGYDQAVKDCDAKLAQGLESQRKANDSLEVAAQALQQLRQERDDARAALREASEEARKLRAILYPTQQIPVALAAVDRYNALIDRLASGEGFTQVEHARRRIVEAAKEWRAADRAEVQDLTLEALEKVEAAVDALEQLEARQ